jgi:hypothetical protein
VSIGPSPSRLVSVALSAALLAGGPLALAGAAQPVARVDDTPGTPRLDGLSAPDLTLAATMDLKVITLRDGRQQLRFTSAVVNLGQGPLVVAGRRPAPGQPWEVVQQFIGPDGSVEREIPVNVQPVWGGDGHNHWHVPDVARYRLLRLDDGGVVARNHKIGFCFYDNKVFRSLPETPQYPGFPDDTGCAHGDPEATSFRMGLSVGFADIYRWRVPGQSIDITGLPGGRYRLEGRANGDDALYQTAGTNHLGWVDFRLIRDHRTARVEILGYSPTPEPDDSDLGTLVLDRDHGGGG